MTCCIFRSQTLCALLVLTVSAVATAAETTTVGVVQVSIPPKVGGIQSAAPLALVDLPKSEFIEQEFFIGGKAARYRNDGTWTSDGRWNIKPRGQEAYTTRIIVRRPTDAKRFNGVVLVEWLNVSRGYDADSTYAQLWPLLLREGYAWVGVSAQKGGIDALKASVGDPVRYASMKSGSTDGFSYDIYSQVANAVRTQPDVLLGGLRVRHVFAIGTSQSAGRLVTYVNAIHPLARVFDGFLIHARSGAGAPLDNVLGVASSASTGDTVAVPAPSKIRTDVNVPVFVVNSETDAPGYFPARQPDSAKFRYWEVAGSAHAPRFRNIYSNGQVGLPLESEACELPANDMPFHHVLQAALAHLTNWTMKGALPPSLPKLDVAGDPLQVRRDAHGNAVGGIRLPEMNVPIARYAPRAEMTSQDPVLRVVCPLAGSVEYWTNSARAGSSAGSWAQPSLKALYLDHDDYVGKFTRSAREAVSAGYVLEPSAKESMERANRSAVGK